MRDFEPIWLDDHLNYLIRPRANALAPGAPQSTASELLKVIIGFLQAKGGTASSRDIGRTLQGTVANGVDMLSQLKQRHFGLPSGAIPFASSASMGRFEADAPS